MWLFYVLLAGTFFTVQGLLTRHILKGQKDAWAFSFFFSIVGAIVSFPFMLASLHIPTDFFPWMIAIVTSALIVLHNFFNFKASNYLEASILGAITKFRLVWLFIFGLLFLQESFTLEKLLGLLLTLIAGILIVTKFNNRYQYKGIMYVFIATIIYACVISIYKYLFNHFTVASATFFVVFFIPAIINMLIMPRFRTRISTIMRKDGKFVLFATGFGGLANLSINQAFALGEVSRVSVISEAFLITILVLEYFILKEKNNLKTKILAVACAVLGAVFMIISF